MVRAVLIDDAVPDERRVDHDLDRRHTSEAISARHEALRDCGLEHGRQLDPDLPLLMRREDRDDAHDRFRCVERVQRRKDNVAGFSCEERSLDRFEVTHLADQDHVGILTQRAAERVRKRRRVDRHFTLADDRLVVPMQILDRVLDGHDVRRPCRVDVIDHRREGRALAAARGPGDQNETTFFLGDFLENGRQAELVNGLDTRGNDAQDHPDGTALLEHIAAEPTQARDAIGQVDFLRLAELLVVFGQEEDARHRLGIVAIEPFLLRSYHQRAVDPHHRVAADLEVQVGCAGCGGNPQQIIEMHALSAWPSGERRARRK